VPEIMTIEGLPEDSTMRRRRNFGMVPILGDMGDIMGDAKHIGIGALTALGAYIAGDLSNLYPATAPMAGKAYTKSIIRLALAAGCYYGLRRFNHQAAELATMVLAGGALYQLAKPWLIKVPKLGGAVKAGLGDIVVEDRLLGQLTQQERAYLSEVRQDEFPMLPPQLSEVVQEDFEGVDVDEDDVIMSEGVSGMPNFGTVESMSWLG